MPVENAGPPCQCGCGERLPLYSKRRFKNGHRKAMNRAVTREYANTVRAEQGRPTRPSVSVPSNPTLQTDNVTVNPGRPNDTIEGGGEEEATTDPFAAFGHIPDDPDPDSTFRDNTKPDPDPPTVINQKVRDDIQGKITFLLGMSSSMLAPMDPLCIGVFNDNLPNISAKIVPIICQSDDLVKWFTKGSGFLMWLELASALWPVIQVIIAHHVTKSVAVENGQVKQRDMSQFKA